MIAMELLYDPYKIHLRIEKTQQNGKLFCVVYCSAKAKPFDNIAEFIIDDISKENIAIVGNKCINKEKKQCSYDYCTCSPDLNAFTVNFTLASLNVGQVFACQMRFFDKETEDIIKIYNSRRFNGTELSGLYKECETCPSMAIWGFCYSCALFFCTMCSDFHVVVNHEHIILKIEESGIGHGKTIKCEMCYNLKSNRVCTKCSKLLCKNCNCIHSNVPTNVKLLKQNVTKTYKCHGKTGIMNKSDVKATISSHCSYSLTENCPKIGGISFFHRNKIVAVDSKNESIIILGNEKGNDPLEHPIRHEPNGMVKMSFSEVAISCSYKRQIEIFDFSTHEFKLMHTIDMQLIGQPFNISYNEEHFVVEIGDFDNGFIVVIDRNAKEIARIKDLDGITNCTGHSIKLALDMKSKHIFLAAAMKMTVSSVDFEGNILWLIAIPSPSDLIFVPQLMSYGRNILLASEKTNTVLFVNASDGCFEDFISFSGPRYIAFDSIENLLAVYNKSGSITIYELGKTSTEIKTRDFSI
ncbi:unnamed protein product [Mytilus coruscus]|uniref:B box-type domain-containing protein n=1 Tax=Mytilus coruscus TaxID=42192 RepID=A0A6J8A142_MYTCO|nr:unnamed protein product [Mytilus coruscus]